MTEAILVPGGWIIYPDPRTDNMIVHNGKVGFSVSSVCLRQWSVDRITADVEQAISDYEQYGHSEVVTFYTIEELDRQANE